MKFSKILPFAIAATAVGAGAAVRYRFKSDADFRRNTEELAGRAVNGIVKGISDFLPNPELPDISEYKSENFYPGHSEFRDSGKRGARWRLGYARRSLVPEDYLSHDYYIAGYLSYPPNVMSEVLDDQAVRVICLDDGSGRGSVVFAVIDCIGISLTDVRRIRARLSDFAHENNIASLNVSATHCHSAIDTQGLWGDLPAMLKNNRRAVKDGRTQDIISGRDPGFMENLYEKTSEAVREAFCGMQRGKLMYARTDELNYARDKRPPYIWDKDIVRLRFVPDGGGRETVAAFMAAHPTALGEKNTRLSSDYIYYIEEEVNKAGKNFIFFQGAQLSIAPERGWIDDSGEGEGFRKYGRGVGSFLLSIPEENEERVQPILNIRCEEFFMPADNHVLVAASKAGLVNNPAFRDKGSKSGIGFVSEIGYAEIGKTLRLALVPGELAPEILLGGAYSSSESFNRTAWTYPPLRSMLAENKELTAVGLCNDSVGYILPDNDYGSIVAKNHYEESVSAGGKAGSTLVKAFSKLLEDCGRLGR